MLCPWAHVLSRKWAHLTPEDVLCPWGTPALTRKQGAHACRERDMTGQLTNILKAMALYNLGKLQVTSNHCHLVGGLVGIVERITLTTPKQEQTCTALLAVHSTDMQWGVTRCITRIHVCSIEQQLLKMLHQSISTCLCTNLTSETLCDTHHPMRINATLENFTLTKLLTSLLAK